MSTPEADHEVKKKSSNWMPTSEGNNKFKGTTYKEQEVLSVVGTRGKYV